MVILTFFRTKGFFCEYLKGFRVECAKKAQVSKGMYFGTEYGGAGVNGLRGADWGA